MLFRRSQWHLTGAESLGARLQEGLGSTSTSPLLAWGSLRQLSWPPRRLPVYQSRKGRSTPIPWK